MESSPSRQRRLPCKIGRSAYRPHTHGRPRSQVRSLLILQFKNTCFRIGGRLLFTCIDSPLLQLKKRWMKKH